MAEKPIWQKYHVNLWVNRDSFDAVRVMLMEKYGLVQARNSRLTTDLTIVWQEGRKLVYADSETGLGIYRVDFREKTYHRLVKQWPGDLIGFGYWNLDSRPPHIREDDPMKAALIDTCNLIHPNHVTLGFEIGKPVDLESLLGIK